MTRLFTPLCPDTWAGHSADRFEIFRLLADSMLPEMPTLEALLDRIERQEGRA